MRIKRLFLVGFMGIFVCSNLFFLDAKNVKADGETGSYSFVDVSTPNGGNPTGNNGNDNSNNNNGRAGNNGSWSTCVNYCTNVGATWMYYEWDGNTEIKTNADPTSGRKEGDTTPFAQNYTFPPEGVEVCSKTKGYYRYAYVRMSDGKQNGVARTNNNAVKWVDSVKYGGQTAYNVSVAGSLQWDEVRAEFLRMNPGGEALWDAGVSIFCGYSETILKHPECPSAPRPNAYILSGKNEGWSSVRTQVTNGSNGWSNNVYAKPGDWVIWEHCYFPGMQFVADSLATKSHPHEPTTISNEQAQSTFNNVVNKSLSSFGYWVNTYNVKNRQETASGSNGTDLPFNYGDSRVQVVDNGYPVEQNWVGNSSYEQSSLVGDIYHAKVWTTSSDTWKCTYKKGCFVDVPVYQWKTGGIACSSGSPPKQAANGSWFCEYGTLQDEYAYTEDCYPQGYHLSEGQHYCNSTRNIYKQDACTGEKDCKHSTNIIESERNKDLNGGLSSEIAYVHVPYNYKITGSATLAGDVVYAGETATIKTGEVKLNNRINNATHGEYMTMAKGVKAWFVTYVSSTSDGNNPITEKRVEKDPSFEGDLTVDNPTKSFNGKTVNVDDVTVGNKYFCVALKYTPTESNGDTDMDGYGRGEATSGASCKPIAKRPTVQIWGGSLFSNSNITTSRAEKNNLNGFADRSYKISGVSDANVFGSWDEQSTMVLGINTGFGSGAATANRLNKTGSAQQGRFESTTNGGFCKYESPLTFANFTKKMAIPICGANNNQSGKFGTTAVSVDKESYITSVVDTKPTSGFVGTTPFAIGSVINGTPTYSVVKSGTGKEILYTMGQNGKDVQLSASVIGKGKTYIIYSYKDVIIQGDITYENVTSEAGEEIKSDDIPKLIIYAKNSIRIDCGVKRVDAVLIGENEIDDCRGYGLDVNASQLSNQLVINGTIITDKAYMKRTYGAGTGKYSGIPAEIINYDSTLVIWARSRADTGETGVLNATYTHELAPRY